MLAGSDNLVLTVFLKVWHNSRYLMMLDRFFQAIIRKTVNVFID